MYCPLKSPCSLIDGAVIVIKSAMNVYVYEWVYDAYNDK
jgi:hypothetical protein